MKFQVPQFIEVEDKIFGPLTLKQFIYLCGGGGLCVIFYLVMPFYLAILFILPVAAFSLALAFYKINNKPFIFVLEAAAKYLISDHLYVWRRVERPATPAESAEANAPTDDAGILSRMGNSKLKEMSWSLDTKGENIPVAESKTTNTSPAPIPSTGPNANQNARPVAAVKTA
jgi:hypothetical protein